MKAKELRQKNEVELRKELGIARKKLRELRFKAALKQLKNHREIPFLKKDIARVILILQEKALLSAMQKTRKKEAKSKTLTKSST
jgi:large subunit ribosomal protein L29